MTTPSNDAVSVTRGEPRSRTELVLEAIALRHQIAVLKRSRTRRPCFRGWDRFFWVLLSWWWPRWRQALMIVQPETVVRWRHDGWSALWRYSSRGRWRGGRPRVSRELRQLIVRMARENFLWVAPRIHGELLMLGYKISQATVSRDMPTAVRRPGQSWRTFIRNQAIAFSLIQSLEQDSDSETLRSWNRSSGGSDRGREGLNVARGCCAARSRCSIPSSAWARRLAAHRTLVTITFQRCEVRHIVRASPRTVASSVRGFHTDQAFRRHKLPFVILSYSRDRV